MNLTKTDEMIIITAINLQLFADGGGDGGAGAAPGEAAPGAGESAATGEPVPDAGGRRRQKKADKFTNVVFGRGESADIPPQQQPEPEPAKEPEETFESLRKGKYKKEADEWAQSLIQKRFRDNKAVEERLNKIAPTVQLLAERYGIKAGEDGSYDLDAINKAVTDDDSYYEDAAAERGLSVETYKQVRQLEAEKARRDAQDARALEERRMQEGFARLVEQGNALKQIYPQFDLSTELENPTFGRLTALGIDARTAYEVIHKDQIMAAGMTYAAQTAAQKVSNSVQSNSRRPVENGLSGNSPAQTRITDPKLLTKDQRAELRRRVRMGEKVVW